jgi:hypothetical protein
MADDGSLQVSYACMYIIIIVVTSACCAASLSPGRPSACTNAASTTSLSLATATQAAAWASAGALITMSRSCAAAASQAAASPCVILKGLYYISVDFEYLAQGEGDGGQRCSGCRVRGGRWGGHDDAVESAGSGGVGRLVHGLVLYYLKGLPICFCGYSRSAAGVQCSNTIPPCASRQRPRQTTTRHAVQRCITGYSHILRTGVNITIC